MTSPLLETKFHVPRRRSGVVERPRLTDRLNRIRQSTLTLVSAPAGFGKSTAVTEWVSTDAAVGRGTAWLSLDERDNDPGLFWTYLVAALRTAEPDLGAGALDLLQSGQSMDAVLATLLNDLNSIPGDIVVVLDDYHVIEAPGVRDGMVLLVDHLPAHVHLVITSRTDPDLPLARLRARGELVEIRAADLRFTADEAGAYLNGTMGLELSEGDVAALEGRTEGWIAALQLAALSMQGRDDVEAFIAGFAGDDRFVVDYLVGEVLERQPEAVRNFLLRTSILTRLNGSLSDAVTGGQDGQAMLETLDRGNLFVIPLDDRRHWYRYHHLFAEVLRARLADEEPGLVGELHRRAADWCELHGDRFEAVGHALAGRDFERAAELIERAVPAMRQLRQEFVLRAWLEALPAEIFAVRPVLSVQSAGALMATGQLDGVDARLSDAERWLDAHPDGVGDGPSTGVVVDEENLRLLPISIAMFRAGQARLRGDLPATLTQARRVLELAGEGDLLERGAASSLLGLAYWSNGELDEAHHWFAEGMATLEGAGHHADVIAGTNTLADIRIAQGRLSDALADYERALFIGAAQVPPIVRGAADMHVGISELLRERNDLEGAREHLAMSTELGELGGFAQYPYRWRVATALVCQIEGDLAGAIELLDEAERVYDTDFGPEVRRPAAVRARVLVAQGRASEALAWTRSRNLSSDDELTYVREYEHITLARALVANHIAAGDPGAGVEAEQLLERLLAAARDGKRTGSIIEVLVLQALTHDSRGDRRGAVAILDEALTLAQPEGYTRVFLDEGPSMTVLLGRVAQEGTAREQARRVLGSTGLTETRAQVHPGLVVPLSDRELDVLRLLRTELDGPDIARELMVSLNTMRTHTKSIYSKLGVNSRRAAVRRAEELGL